MFNKFNFTPRTIELLVMGIIAVVFIIVGSCLGFYFLEYVSKDVFKAFTFGYIFGVSYMVSLILVNAFSKR